MRQLILIAARSLVQHKLRTALLGGAIAFVTALLLILTGLSHGLRTNMLTSATTLMTGHVNVGGFYKVTAGQSAPVVTEYKKLLEVVRKEVPELAYVTQRGRGWAKLISETSSAQVGIAGIDIEQEPGFSKVVTLQQGKLEDLKKKNSLLIFEKQATRLGVKVGDTMTFSAPTFRGVNNTIDVTVVAIANNVGLLSSFNVYLQADSLRQLYQLKPDTTGALLLYVKDMKKIPEVQARLREKLSQAGYGVMADDPRAFWEKFEVVNREDWTGQKLDVTNWEDEISFLKWADDALTGLSVFITIILVVIICIGIMNVMWITIRERTREMGTLRAIGMQRRTVLAMFVIEGALLGLVGTASGAAIGWIASELLTVAKVPLPIAGQMFLMSEVLVLMPTAFWVVFSIGFITACITAVSLVPSFLAARMKPITAMHHVG